MPPMELSWQVEAGLCHVLLIYELGYEGEGLLGQPGTILGHCVDAERQAVKQVMVIEAAQVNIAVHQLMLIEIAQHPLQ